MKFAQLSFEEYKKFALNHPNISIYQYPEWGQLKSNTGWDYYFVGLKKENNILAATMLLRKKVILNLYLFYAPRGYLIDSKNKNLLTEFNNYVIEFVKQHKGFMLKIDPNVVYNILDNNGKVINCVGQEDFNNYNSLGFKYIGKTLNFETMQPRFLCRYKIMDDYENTLATFSKSTQKNILKAHEYGVKCEKVNMDNVDLFTNALSKTAVSNHMPTRPAWYYKKLLELFSDDVVYFLTYLDTNEYYNYVLKSLKQIEKQITEINNKIETYANVGNKLRNELKSYSSQKEKLEKELKEALNYKKINNKIYIGALMSVFTGDEGITFNSGTDHDFKKFNIKYAYYDAHLKESIKRKKKYVNFYGISGDFNKNSKYYNIYEIKKGYNPEVLELLGEFDYILSKPKFLFYKVALYVYKKIKK